MESIVGLNQQQQNVDQIMLVDELSDTEYYIGTSDNFSSPSDANWRIKRIIKIGSVWKFEFPEGDQRYKWIWDNRLSYTYWT